MCFGTGSVRPAASSKLEWLLRGMPGSSLVSKRLLHRRHARCFTLPKQPILMLLSKHWFKRGSFSSPAAAASQSRSAASRAISRLFFRGEATSSLQFLLPEPMPESFFPPFEEEPSDTHSLCSVSDVKESSRHPGSWNLQALYRRVVLFQSKFWVVLQRFVEPLCLTLMSIALLTVSSSSVYVPRV